MAEKYKKEINCPICEGKAKLITTDMKLFKGDIIVKNTHSYKCSKCKLEFNTSKQVQEAEQKLRKSFFFKRQIISTGGSLGITFPSDLSEYYGLNQGTKVSIIPKNKNTIEIITQKK